MDAKLYFVRAPADSKFNRKMWTICSHSCQQFLIWGFSSTPQNCHPAVLQRHWVALRWYFKDFCAERKQKKHVMLCKAVNPKCNFQVFVCVLTYKVKVKNICTRQHCESLKKKYFSCEISPAKRNRHMISSHAQSGIKTFLCPRQTPRQDLSTCQSTL